MIPGARASLTTTASKRDRAPAAAAHLPGFGRLPVKLAGNGTNAGEGSHAGRIGKADQSKLDAADRAGDRRRPPRAAPPGTVASFAHTLKGSARGIGAWQVAEAAEAVELAANGGDAAALRGALKTLATAVAAARAAITELLRAR